MSNRYVTQKIEGRIITLTCRKCGARETLSLALPRKSLDWEIDKWGKSHVHPTMAEILNERKRWVS